jgi:NAD(P)H-flavin reductase
LEPYESVCYKCADELYAIMEKCNKDCLNCEVTTIWGLSIKDCLEFLNSLEDTKGLLRILNGL